MDEPISSEEIDAVCGELYAGRKIAAIKRYREASGKGLKEAREFIEQLEARLREEAPEKFSSPSSGTRCAGAPVLLFLIGYALTRALAG